MTDLWSVADVATFLNVSKSRARAILAENSIERITGYPADAVKDIRRPGQGARTDLKDKGMFDALDLRSRAEFQFKSLDTLARRYGGDDFQIVHSEAFQPARRHVEILRRNRKAGENAFDILARVSVPSEAVDTYTPLTVEE